MWRVIVPKGVSTVSGRYGERRYVDPGVSTSQCAADGATLEFDNVADQLRQVVAFMQRQFGMTMDGADLS
ncbi:hypothetical protein Scep_026505 [Stephania cephalantha]|uniref:Uncharacterized protein n=1 Tax=Stephania cephalantha TaxID=152367 RepID=A0AAP0EKA8_9MAGN